MTDYSQSAKFLHQLILGNGIVGELCFDIEWLFERDKVRPSINGRHVFVSGLARAGTTALMRALHDTDEFASLTYRDMPFVLSPNLWQKISRRNLIEMEKQERAHGDGIMVDFDSPEALEEVFWKTFLSDAYIRKDKLLVHSADKEVIAKFRDYISLVLLRYGKNRYLSKNNNNILRMESILEAFPHAVILVPFRSPLQHAYSLLKQHRKFLVEQVRQPFTRKYMGWLAHHEFGGDHRPFEWDSTKTTEAETDTIDYWLLQWVSVYHVLLEKTQSDSGRSSRICFLCYESICSDTEMFWNALSEKLGIVPTGVPEFNLQVDDAALPENKELLKEAEALYEKLLHQFRIGLFASIT